MWEREQLDMDDQKPISRGPGSSSAYDRLAALFARRNYELLGELGRGGMGVVYLAKDKKLGRKVALKTLSPDRAARENSLRRFEREARTFAGIHHPNIATLFEFEDEGPLQYLALEYINGYDLESERRRGKKWPPEEAARIIQTIAGALQYTHQKGVLHRDIKPGNILIERETNRVVLTDFGLAKGNKDETLTASGFAVGTPAYMAPEQISDQFGVRPDGRADIFSLGAVFYEMLTAKHPFLGQDDLKTMRNIVHNEHKSLRELDPHISRTLESVISKMLAKQPDDRYPSCSELYEDLDRWLNQKEATGTLPAMDIPKPLRLDEIPTSSPKAKEKSSSRPPMPAPESAKQAPTAQPAAAAPEKKAGFTLTNKHVILISVVIGVIFLLGIIVGSFLFSGK